MNTLNVIGGVLFGLYFVMMGAMHFKNSHMLAQYANSKKVPYPKIAVIFTGLMLFVGGLSILLDSVNVQLFASQRNFGAWLIIVFLFFVSFMMHAFWKDTNPQEKMMNMTHFMKNWALLAAALMLLK
ncbi:MAG: DoxX family protein [bacterium]|nr:DoxX family protein [bacterium]